MVGSSRNVDNVSVAIVCSALTMALRPVGRLLASGSAQERATLGASEEGERDERTTGVRDGHQGPGQRGQ